MSALLDDISLRLLAKGWSLIPGTPSDQRILTRGRLRLGMREQENGNVVFQFGPQRVELDLQKPDFSPFGEWPDGLGLLFWEAARSPNPEAAARVVAEEKAESLRLRQFPGYPRRLSPWLLLGLLGLAYLIGERAETALVLGADLRKLSWQAQPWRWISSSWLNFWSLWLFFQLFWLARWGRYIERWLGARAWLSILSLSALAASWVQESSLLSFGSFPLMWGSAGAYLCIATFWRSRLPRGQRPIWPLEVPLILALELWLTGNWTSTPHWAALVTGFLAGALLAQSRWASLRDALRGWWALSPAALLAVLWCAWRYPDLPSYSSRLLGGGSGHYSIEVPDLFVQQDGGWTAPGMHLVLSVNQLSESEACLQWPAQAEQVWQLWREGAMEWAAVERAANFRVGKQLWLIGQLRTLEEKRPALCAMTVDHESFYCLTCYYEDDSQREYFRNWLKTLQVRQWSSGYYVGLAKKCRDQGCPALASRFYDRAYALDSKAYPVAMARSWLRYSLDWAKPEEAVAAMEIAKSDNQRAGALRLQATILAQTNLKQSRAIYRNLLVKCQDRLERSRVLNSWAWSESEHGDNRLALQKILESLKLERTSANLDTYATVLLRAGRYREALEALQQIPELEQEEVYILHLAEALEGLGRNQEAADYFSWIFEGSSRYARRAKAHYQTMVARGLVKVSEEAPPPES